MKMHNYYSYLFVAILATLLTVSCGDDTSEPGPTPDQPISVETDGAPPIESDAGVQTPDQGTLPSCPSPTKPAVTCSDPSGTMTDTCPVPIKWGDPKNTGNKCARIWCGDGWWKKSDCKL